jgi:IS30 family transposase
MVDGVGIARVGPIERRCATCAARRSRNSCAAGDCGPLSQRNSSTVGLRNRSRVGWWKRSPTIRRCGCRTRPSTCRCSCRPEVRYAKELTRHLRLRHSARRPGSNRLRNGQGHIPAMVNIRERPAEADDRAVPGHWEGDLIFGQGKGVVATLVERHSRFVMLIGLPTTHTADVVADALAAKITELPAQLRRSLTWDQGREMAQHAAFTIATGVPVYFCDPRSPWQRGSNENTNGLLRQYLPRNSRLGDRTQAELDHIATELNGRPRQTLGWKTPSQALDRAML